MKKIFATLTLSLTFLLNFSFAQSLVFANTYCDSLPGNLYSIEETYDGNFITCGFKFPGHYIGVLLKIDLNGNVLWQKNFNSIMEATSVKQTSDSGFIIYGHSDSLVGSIHHDKLNIIKTNSIGDSLWSVKFTGFNWSQPYNIEITHDGGFIVCSRDTSSSPYKILLTKLSATGSVEWHHTYSINFDLSCNKIIQTYDNGYMFNGKSVNGHLFKVDSVGTLLWDSSYDHLPSLYIDELFSLEKLIDSSIVIVGRRAWSSTIELIKYDVAGNTLVWDSLIVPNQFWIFGSKAQADGGFIITGDIVNTEHRFYCAKFNSQCQFQWDYWYDTPNPTGTYYNDCYDIAQSSVNGNYYMAGGTQAILDGYYPTIVSWSKWPDAVSNIPQQNSCNISSSLDGSLQIQFAQSEKYSLEIFDLNGKLISRSSGNNSVVNENFNLSSGIYLIKVSTKDFTESKLFPVVK